LITRLIAVIPAVVCTALYGVSGTAKLLVFSQVVLSMQLSFAVIPLIMFTSDRQKMGQFVNPVWIKVLAWITAAIIVALNIKFLADFFGLTTKIMSLFS
jgi:manganese transport protein